VDAMKIHPFFEAKANKDTIPNAITNDHQLWLSINFGKKR
jgi:hypothetical protein